MISQKLLEWLLIFLALVFPFGVLTKIPIYFSGFPEVKIYLIDVLVFLIFFIWIGWLIFYKKQVNLPRFWPYLFGWLAILAFSWSINLRNYMFKENFVGFLYLLRYLIYSSLLLIIYSLKKTESKIGKKFIVNCFKWWGVFLSFLGIGQYIFIPDTRFLFFLGWDEHYYRVIGPFFDPNFIGLLLGLGILRIIWEIGEIKESWENWKRIVLSVFLGIPFLLTYSRSSYLALIAGIAVILVLKKKLRYFFFFLFLFLFSILLLPRPGGEGVKLERVASVFQRIESWQTALGVWEKHPIFGVGFNNYRYALGNLGNLSEGWHESHAGAGVENSFLFVLATGGVIGIIGLIAFIVRLIKEMIEAERTTKYLVLPSLVAILVHGLFINSFFYPWVMVWFWFLIGLV